MEEKRVQKSSKSSLIILVLILALFAAGYYVKTYILTERPAEDSPYIGTYELQELEGYEGINYTYHITLNKNGTGIWIVHFTDGQEDTKSKIRWADTETGFKMMCPGDKDRYFVKHEDKFYQLNYGVIPTEEEIEKIKNNLTFSSPPYQSYLVKTK